MSTAFQFTTDTSTFCVFDLAALSHRIEDDSDWWVHPPSAQVAEVNSGSAAFIDLGGDGRYVVALEEEVGPGPCLSVLLSCPSGRVFLGAAEETTAEGMEPDCTRGGLLISIQPGVYLLRVARPDERMLRLSLQPVDATAANYFSSPLCLAKNSA
jgi:hypothetical protein